MSQLYERLKQQAQAHPTALAIVEDETRWTYEDLHQKAVQLASSLSQQGVQPGDRVTLMFFNQKEFLVSLYAVLYLGAVAVPINIQLTPEDIFYVVMNSGSRAVLTNATFAPHFQGKPLPFWACNQDESIFPSWEQLVEQGDSTFHPQQAKAPNTLSILMYTSGTTGKPKGVMLSEENLMSNMDGFSPVLHFTAEDKVLLALPLFHAFGLIIALYATRVGAPLVLVPKFAPKKILHSIASEQVTILPLVPTLFSLLLEGTARMGVEPFQSLRFCVSGGASLPSELLKRIESTLNITVLEGYGLTETSPVLAVNSLERGSIPQSVGKPLPNVQLKLIDLAGQEVPWQPGTASGEGEIYVKGPNVMMGYYQLPEETTQVLDADGWFQTGDLGHLDAEGNLFISGGRKKDLIIKAGENIAPIQIESVLYQHPAILEASVIGVPDPVLGEDVLACVQFKEGQQATEAELKKFCQERLPALLVPALFRIYDELPKNPAGKILKPLLRSQNAS